MGLSTSEIYELHQLLGKAKFVLEHANFTKSDDPLGAIIIFNEGQVKTMTQAIGILEKAYTNGPD